MWKGKDQTTIYLNFSQIHRGPKDGQTVTRPLPHIRSSFDSPYKLHTHVVRPKVTQPERNTIVAWSLDTQRQRGKCICILILVWCMDSIF